VEPFLSGQEELSMFSEVDKREYDAETEETREEET
jgi:hypothetical protein